MEFIEFNKLLSVANAIATEAKESTMVYSKEFLAANSPYEYVKELLSHRFDVDSDDPYKLNLFRMECSNDGKWISIHAARGGVIEFPTAMATQAMLYSKLVAYGESLTNYLDADLQAPHVRSVLCGIAELLMVELDINSTPTASMETLYQGVLAWSDDSLEDIIRRAAIAYLPANEPHRQTFLTRALLAHQLLQWKNNDHNRSEDCS